MTRFCEFTGDGKHGWDEVGYKKLCEFAGFAYCTLHKKPIKENEEGWRVCCAECETPVQVKETAEMSKLKKLEAAIERIPDEYSAIRVKCRNCLEAGSLLTLQTYTSGLWDMAFHLTSEERLFESLDDIRELLR